MKLIVGLGNPGKKYEKTRHNVGFMVLNGLREELVKYNINEWELSKKFNAQISGCTIDGEKIILAKPMTFMNDSGQTTQMIMHYYKVLARDLVVIHDDKDIKLGEIKIQSERGAAGHNGVKSIIESIGSNKFNRVRVGVASKNEKKMSDTSKFVLGRFGVLEKKTLKLVLQKSIDELLKLIT